MYLCSPVRLGGGIGRHAGLKHNLSALPEREGVEYRKFKEALTGHADGNLEPSPRNGEGAETRHGTSKGRRAHDEGIVQTTN